MTVLKKSKDEGSGSASLGLFSSFRDLGLICDDIPFNVVVRGGVAFVVCSVGYTYHVYTLEKLELVFIGPEFSDKISALVSWKDYTVVATGHVISVIDRNTELARFNVLGQGAIFKLMALGDMLLAVTSKSISIFDLSNNMALLHQEKFAQGCIVDVVHPETYLNKILIAFANGSLIIYNIKTLKQIHEFTDFTSQKLTYLAVSPDPDIVGLGFINGTVCLYELKKAQQLLKFKVESAVTSIAFRTDDNPHIAIGTASGEISIFNLESRKLEAIVRAHSAKVSTIWFVPQQPLFISSSSDNSLKEYLNDASEYKLLRERSGHYRQINKVRFFGEDGRYIISAAADRSLRFSSTTKDNQAFEFSQGSIERTAARLKVTEEEIKLPEIVSIDIFETKTVRWDNMVTAHAGQTYVKTWRLDHKAIGQHTLQTPDKSVVTHVSFSSCGNFVLCSTTSGSVFVFNVQSGILRKSIKSADNDPTVASFTDATNTCIYSVSASGTIRCFSFQNKSLLSFVDVNCKISKAIINKETEMLAIAGSDHVARVIDYSAMRVVRVFQGHSAEIRDICFSADSKWLLTASCDRSICTWDLPSGKQLDLLKTRNVPVAIALSRNLEFLAVSLENSISLSLFSNRSLYSGDCFSFAKEWSVPVAVSEQAGDDILLSGQSSSRWKNIYFLEKIRANTKPIAAVAAKKQALPFFLAQALEQESNSTPNVLAAVEAEVTQSSEDFLAFLDACVEEKNYRELLNRLIALHPSKLDFEISCIPNGTKSLLLEFILMSLNLGIRAGSDFELVQAILALVLRHHCGYLSANIELFSSVLCTLEASIKEKWLPLEDLTQRVLCGISFIREN